VGSLLHGCVYVSPQLSENATWVLSVDLSARVGRVFLADTPSPDGAVAPFKVLAGVFNRVSGLWGVMDTDHKVRNSPAACFPPRVVSVALSPSPSPSAPVLHCRWLSRKTLLSLQTYHLC
jgi:hypothetical protein